eukprot:TRINITY_DN76391_c0_g1_i1.p1 TRINITY_DN76391_c0_g1~~TRINITY_DN76391_c0_g1_i1.p1  ORF type:complete len:304 (-),score=47.36 TRINITY_DN76391_c0_g1_i1:80-970(-)
MALSVQNTAAHQRLEESSSEGTSSDSEGGCCACGAYDDDMVPVVEQTTDVKAVPLEIRRGFIRKVYGILFCMLLLSFSIVLPFVLRPEESLAFCVNHRYILWLCIGFLAIQTMINYCVMAEIMCGRQKTCTKAYMGMFVTFPVNYAFLLTYSVVFGILFGIICTSYTASSVALCFVMTAVIVLALTVYACVTKTDFTGYGMYLVAAFGGLSMLLFFSIFIPGDFVHLLVAVLGTVIVSFSIIYDTQLIVGTAKVNCSSRVGGREFTLDMYAFAAFQLYLGFMNMFLFMLRIFGKRN